MKKMVDIAFDVCCLVNQVVALGSRCKTDISLIKNL